MGMFDSLFDADGREWQTKAFERNLDEFAIGDTIPADCSASYQVEVVGRPDGEFVESYATVRRNVLTAVGDERDASLPLIGFSGGLIPEHEAPR